MTNYIHNDNNDTIIIIILYTGDESRRAFRNGLIRMENGFVTRETSTQYGPLSKTKAEQKTDSFDSKIDFVFFHLSPRRFCRERVARPSLRHRPGRHCDFRGVKRKKNEIRNEKFSHGRSRPKADHRSPGEGVTRQWPLQNYLFETKRTRTRRTE